MSNNILILIAGLIFVSALGLGGVQISKQLASRGENTQIAVSPTEYTSEDTTEVTPSSETTTASAPSVRGENKDNDDDSREYEDEDGDDDRNQTQNQKVTPQAPSPTPTPTPAPTKSPSTGAQSYTLAQVQAHNSQASCYTTINGSVYDVTTWISRHPGGARAILSLCGKDGSSAFNDQHGGQRRPESELAGFKIGVLAK